MLENTANLTNPNPQLKAWQENSVHGMAHWAGTGPAETTCHGCALFRQIRKPVGVDGKIPREGRCRRYIAVNRALHDGAPVHYIPPSTPSCRFFEAKS